jgi:hypothetical protein
MLLATEPGQTENNADVLATIEIASIMAELATGQHEEVKCDYYYGWSERESDAPLDQEFGEQMRRTCSEWPLEGLIKKIFEGLHREGITVAVFSEFRNPNSSNGGGIHTALTAKWPAQAS